MDWLEGTVSFLNTALWGWLMAPLLLSAGIYFTIRLRFLQIRAFPHMLRVMRASTRAEHGGITSFAAFATSLAAGGILERQWPYTPWGIVEPRREWRTRWASGRSCSARASRTRPLPS